MLDGNNNYDLLDNLYAQTTSDVIDFWMRLSKDDLSAS